MYSEINFNTFTFSKKYLVLVTFLGPKIVIYVYIWSENTQK